MCSKLFSGIRNWMDKVTQHFEYMYDSNGQVTEEFCKDLKALPCLGVATEGCPSILIHGEVQETDEQIVVTFKGDRLVADYDYSLYRDTDPDFGAAVTLATGKTTSDTVSFTDTGSDLAPPNLVNGTVYYYKLTVQRAGCDPYSGTTSGTPRECASMPLTVSVIQPTLGDANVDVYISGGIIAGSAISILRNDTDTAPGSVIATGVLGDAQFAAWPDNNGKDGCKYTDNTAGKLLGKTYYYTIQVTEKVGCAAIQAGPASVKLGDTGASVTFARLYPQDQRFLEVMASSNTRTIKVSFYRQYQGSGTWWRGAIMNCATLPTVYSRDFPYVHAGTPVLIDLLGGHLEPTYWVQTLTAPVYTAGVGITRCESWKSTRAIFQLEITAIDSDGKAGSAVRVYSDQTIAQRNCPPTGASCGPQLPNPGTSPI